MFKKLALLACALPLALSAATPDVTVSGQVITVCSQCSASNVWNVGTGQKVYSFTGPATLTLSSSSGNSITYVYVDLPSGNLMAATTATVTGNQIAIVSGTAFPATSQPVFTYTNTMGSWDVSGLTYLYPSTSRTLLNAGPNVTITSNTDGSSTIASTGGGGSSFPGVADPTLTFPIAGRMQIGSASSNGATLAFNATGFGTQHTWAIGATANAYNNPVLSFIDIGNNTTPMQLVSPSSTQSNLEMSPYTLITWSSSNASVANTVDTWIARNAAGTLAINGNSIATVQSGAPASSTAACSVGNTRTDGTYLYVCVANASWKRSTLASF